MENKISFTGIKNLATVKLKREGFHGARNLSMILTDDFNGKDLQAFKDELAKIGRNSSAYTNKDFPDLLNLEYLHGAEDRQWITVNGTALETNDNNLSMFSYLANLMKRVTKNPDRTVDDNYKSYFAKDTLVNGTEISNYDELIEGGYVDKFFNKNEVYNSAKNFCSYIQDIMEIYLGIK